jgi:hypothetical protein
VEQTCLITFVFTTTTTLSDGVNILFFISETELFGIYLPHDYDRNCLILLARMDLSIVHFLYMSHLLE